MNEFGNRLKKIRIEKNMSQKDFASRANIDKSMMCRYETERNVRRMRLFAQLQENIIYRSTIFAAYSNPERFRLSGLRTDRPIVFDCL